MSKNTIHAHCLNCTTRYSEQVEYSQEVFCSKCGQSSKDSRLSFGRLIKDAISNIFNLDSRLIHTFRDLIFPSKLTITYIEGKRKYYVNPARLFFFMLIALITLAISSITLENSSMNINKIYFNAERSKLMDEYNQLVDTIDISGHEIILDSIKSTLFFKVKTLTEDTLGQDGPNIFNWGKNVDSFGISNYDGIHLTQDELFKKYNVTRFSDKLYIGQYIRFVTNPIGGIKHIIKNLTWALFITVLLMSFFMKILYIRKQYYLVEHVVLILNSHSLIFLLTAINIILLVFVPLGNNTALITSLTLGSTAFFVFIQQFLTLKKYYRQGIFKTLLKQLIINFAYLFIFLMTVVMVAIISLILY